MGTQRSWHSLVGRCWLFSTEMSTSSESCSPCTVHGALPPGTRTRNILSKVARSIAGAKADQAKRMLRTSLLSKLGLHTTFIFTSSNQKCKIIE